LNRRATTGCPLQPSGSCPEKIPFPTWCAMKTKSRLMWKMKLAFGVALALLPGVGVASYWNNKNQVENEEWVAHTQEVLSVIAVVLSNTIEAESVQRGHVLTGEGSYSEQYHEVVPKLHANMVRLRTLTADNPSRQRNLDALDRLIAERLALLDQLIELQKSHLVDIAGLKATVMEGTEAQRAIHNLLDEMEKAENMLLKLRVSRAKASTRNSVIAILLGTSLAFGLLCAVLYLLQREANQRALAEEASRCSEERLRMAVEAAEMGTWFWNIEKDEINWSEKFRSLFGLTSDAKLNYQAFLDVTHPDDRQRIDQTVRNALELDVPYDIEYRAVWPDSSVHWIAAKGRAHRSPDGVAVDMQGIVMDVTGRKKAQEMLQHQETLERRSADLKRSNDELQQFAYIAAHDLQEPLRMVASYTQLLARRYKGRLDSDADEFIGYAVDGAHRMQLLIGDLLAYCRVGTKGKELREISSEAALEQALLNLQGVIQESGGVVTHDPLPSVIADGAQLVQLFQNVVGNAIKYRGVELPRVHVLAKKNDDREWIFSIQDNGLGIDPQYFEKIFVMFQRLHGREEFSGTGIGLAVCKRIAERHGGKIWVESKPGKGSTFYFNLLGRG
jgi:PAS domain S-box-containing protein